MTEGRFLFGAGVRADPMLPAPLTLTLSPLRRYTLALGLVVVGFAMRLLLEPVFGALHSYSLFYPVVIVVAYFLGRRPAVAATVLSAVIAYCCFSRPAFAWKADFLTLSPLVFFGFTAGVSIYFITGMAQAVAELGVARTRAEGLARSHAELFREINERVTNHLQLVAGLLQLQARDERDGLVSRALAEASARTLLISRVHRRVAGAEPMSLDFDAFAGQLLDATLAAHATARSGAGVRVEVRREGLHLPVDQATSVAIVLLECLNARLRNGRPAVLSVSLRGDERQATLEISESFDGAGGADAGALRYDLIEAMVEQLGGRFSLRQDAEGATSRLEFPLAGHAAVDPDVALVAPADRVLH
jgi:two-component sensor histidine kinase